MTTIYQWCRKSLSLKIRGKLIFSFSVAMIVLLSALGSITYFTFKDSISSSKKRIAELTLQNHILGFHDLVEELQHDIGETLFPLDLGFSRGSIAELTETLASRTESSPFLLDYFLVRGDRVISSTSAPEAFELQEALSDSSRHLAHGLLAKGRHVWVRSELSVAMGPDMAVYFSLDQEHVWETVLHANSREEGTLFYVASDTDLIVTHLESSDHFESPAHNETSHRVGMAGHHDAGSHHRDSGTRHAAEQEEHDDSHDNTTHAEEPDIHEVLALSHADEDGAHRVDHENSLARLANDENQLLQLNRQVMVNQEQLTRIGRNYVVAGELGLLDWHVLSVMPEASFIADLIKLRNRIITATALTFWISLWIVLIVAHRISGPIISLSAATRDIQDHNYSTPLDFVRRRDEIGDLANSFETMRRDIEQLIHNDSLTGVFNRRYLLKTLGQQVADGLQTDEPVSFIMIDLDRFKAINDTHGHMAGDAVLKMAATTIAQAVEGFGILARYGGEEFCVVLPGIPAPLAHDVAENIRNAVEGLHIRFGDEALTVTCSLGIAELASIERYRSLTHEQVIRVLTTNADLALYHAKDSGRNCSVIYSPGLAIDKAA